MLRIFNIIIIFLLFLITIVIVISIIIAIIKIMIIILLVYFRLINTFLMSVSRARLCRYSQVQVATEIHMQSLPFKAHSFSSVSIYRCSQRSAVPQCGANV